MSTSVITLAQEGVVTHVGSAALLIIGYRKMCLHFQSSGMCIYDYVANPLIFDLDTKTFGCRGFALIDTI